MLVALPAFAAVAAFATLTALGTRTALTFHIAFGLGQKRLARQFELVGLGVYADQLAGKYGCGTKRVLYGDDTRGNRR